MKQGQKQHKSSLFQGIAGLTSAGAHKLRLQDAEVIDILLTREQNYDRLFFKNGLSVLEGASFPLVPKSFEMKKDISARPPWTDVLSAYGLDTRNFSYPKE